MGIFGIAVAIGTDNSWWIMGEQGSYQPIRHTDDTDWATASIGASHECAVKFDGTLWCSGYGDYGQLGNEDSPLFTEVPLQVGTAADWTAVSCGGGHTCAVKTDGSLWCWGFNGSGQLGDGTREDRTVPTRVDSSSAWQTVSLGSHHTCGIDMQDRLYCWGGNPTGALGDGEGFSHFPVPVTLP